MPNYTLGRGKVYFSPFISGGKVPEGVRYMGNTPELSLTIEEERLDHFSADAGIKEKDASVALEVTRSGSMVCDDINKENVALFFFGTSATLAVVEALAEQDDTIIAKIGLTHQIGRTLAKPDGARGLLQVIVKDVTDVTTYVLDTDYTLDLARGQIVCLPAAGITEDDVLHITYDQDQVTMDQVISGASPIEGSIMLLENNPVGENHDVIIPECKISPNGDFALKGDDWRTIPFSIDILKPVNSEAIYRDGQPVAV